jgi:hypothetical protein
MTNDFEYDFLFQIRDDEKCAYKEKLLSLLPRYYYYDYDLHRYYYGSVYIDNFEQFKGLVLNKLDACEEDSQRYMVQNDSWFYNLLKVFDQNDEDYEEPDDDIIEFIENNALWVLRGNVQRAVEVLINNVKKGKDE